MIEPGMIRMPGPAVTASGLLRHSHLRLSDLKPEGVSQEGKIQKMLRVVATVEYSLR